MADLSLQLDQAASGSSSYRDLLIGPDGDLVLTQDADPAGTPAISQALTQKLRFIAGEWFLNVNLGVPYYGQLLGTRGKVAAFEAILQNTVLSTPGIVALLSWNTTLDRARRILTVTFQAQTTSGYVNFTDTISPQTGASA